MRKRRLWRFILVLLLAAGCRKAPPEPAEKGPPTPPPEASSATADATPAPGGGPDVAAQAPGTDAAGTDAGGAADLASMPSLAGIRWSLEPERLDVMRDTRVAFKAVWEGADEADWDCLWDPGDRTGTVRGCAAEHLFSTGLVDRAVTLTVRFRGSEVFSESRPLPLERLPVQELPSDDNSLLPPAPGQGGSRTLFWSLHAAPQGEDIERLVAAATKVQAATVVLYLNLGVDGGATGKLLESLREQVDGAIVPVFCGSLFGAEGKDLLGDGVLTHGADNAPPFRHAFLSAGALYVVLDSRVSDNDVGHEKWMLDQLEKGRVASHRVVLSCRPMESYTAEGTAELTPQFRYYEKLLRGDISALVSGGEPVFYHGSYGNLATVSAGAANGTPGRLKGEQKAQGPLVTIIDLVPGEAAHVFAVRPTAPDSPFDPVRFPRQLGNYERRL